MNFTCYLLLCLVAFTSAGCDRYPKYYERPPDKTCFDLKTFLNRSFNETSQLCNCQTSSIIADLNALKSELQAISSIMFYPPLVYNNKKYLISNIPYKNFADAMVYCTAFGGYLAEINDDPEYRALQSFVLQSQADLVAIGGSDAGVEGSWIFPRTGLPVKILDWVTGQPDGVSASEDCLSLWRTREGKMNDLPCGFRSDLDRFMCEIPNNF